MRFFFYIARLVKIVLLFAITLLFIRAVVFPTALDLLVLLLLLFVLFVMFLSRPL
ncbi:MAG: hypothetical protein JWN30_1087 [Bacilli bacterium]|nr:hypothetical protein [Bacilli bacterium]